MMNVKLQKMSSEFLNERHGLMAFINGLLQNYDEAEDIFQEVWLRLAEAAEKDVEIRDIPKWCRGTAKNLILHHWRSQRNKKIVIDTELLELVQMSFDEQDDNKDYWAAHREAIRQCTEELPLNSKKVLALKYEKNHSTADIACCLQKTVASISMQLSRLRKVIGDCSEKKLKALGIL